MRLPVEPPVAPMLAKAAARIPTEGYGYEPKWDGFRAIVFRDGDEVEIGSRNQRSMNRYFPEVVEAIKEQLPERCVVDGELVIIGGDGERLDFEALQQRIHPADSRVQLLSKETPAHLVVFDLLALGDEKWAKRPYAERRAALEEALAGVESPVHLTPATTDPALAGAWFDQFEGAGLDGVVAKSLEGTYRPGQRTMIKIKHERTADCVLAGYRPHKDGAHLVGSLLLGLYDDNGELLNVGAAGAFTMTRRAELVAELAPLVTEIEGHPWAPAKQEAGTRTPRNAEGSRWAGDKDFTFVPLRPERVVEVKYDHMEGERFRHTAQFKRWRPDREPRSCTYEQLEVPVKFDLDDVLGG